MICDTNDYCVEYRNKKVALAYTRRVHIMEEGKPCFFYNVNSSAVMICSYMVFFPILLSALLGDVTLQPRITRVEKQVWSTNILSFFDYKHGQTENRVWLKTRYSRFTKRD